MHVPCCQNDSAYLFYRSVPVPDPCLAYLSAVSPPRMPDSEKCPSSATGYATPSPSGCSRTSVHDGDMLLLKKDFWLALAFALEPALALLLSDSKYSACAVDVSPSFVSMPKS